MGLQGNGSVVKQDQTGDSPDEAALCIFQGSGQNGRKEMKLQEVKENVEEMRFWGLSEER